MPLPRFFPFFLLMAALAASLGGSVQAQPLPTTAPIELLVDAREVAAQKVAVRLEIPVSPGPLSLQYPRWVPGGHGEVGRLQGVSRLRMQTSPGTFLPWRRDSYDPFTFHCTIPRDTSRLTVTFDYLMETGSIREVSYGVAAGPELAILNWGSLLLAPAGKSLRQVFYAPRLLLPEGWQEATALETVPSPTAGELRFAPVTLERLADSPIFIGAHRRLVRLDSGNPEVPHYLCLFADTQAMADSSLSPSLVENLQRLVQESGALFGGRHYRSFRFLLAVSNRLPAFGLEHHESSVNVLPPSTLGPRGTQDNFSFWYANLLPHEFVHSWNGKFRRPRGLATDSFNVPHSTDLLWIYEGLTEYLGEVLMVRCGFRPAYLWPNDLLNYAVHQGNLPAREWQALADSATAYAWVNLQGAGQAQRTTNDVYFEGLLLWLEADALIRQRTGGRKSLDDFCRVFFGGPNHGPEVRPYTLGDVVDALQSVMPYDWKGFLIERTEARGAEILSSGLATAGWSVVLSDDPPASRRSAALTDYRFSLGLFVAPSGEISEVRPGSAAANAGLVPGARVAGVNGEQFTPEGLREAVRATVTTPQKDTASQSAPVSPIELLIFRENRYWIVRLPYSGGEKVPVLKRNEALPDLLQSISSPVLPIPLGPPPPTR